MLTLVLLRGAVTEKDILGHFQIQFLRDVVKRALTIVKIKFMKVKTFYQVSNSFGLKGRHMWVTEPPEKKMMSIFHSQTG